MASKGERTREKLLDAALAEFRTRGAAAADVATVVRTAGVAHGTFFFHFPTKEHVLLELERREEERLAQRLRRFIARPHRVPDLLAEVIAAMRSLERRLGPHLFRDFLGLHFSSTRPPEQERQMHPVIALVLDDLDRARADGELPADLDVLHAGAFFLVGLYALLVTAPSAPSIRAPMLQEYLAYTLRALGVPPD